MTRRALLIRSLGPGDGHLLSYAWVSGDGATILRAAVGTIRSFATFLHTLASELPNKRAATIVSMAGARLSSDWRLMWGTGTAVFLEKLSRQIERWTTDELGTLADGGRRDGECTTLFTKNLDHNFLA